jgi:hypothetical protein
MRMMVVVVCGALLSGCGKADISQDCTMNGFGEVTCNFTNKGDGEGSLCGTIVVHDKWGRSERSSMFCSGVMGERSTKQVEVSVPAVRELCDHSWAKTWTEVCGFTFQADGEPEPSFAELKAKHEPAPEPELATGQCYHAGKAEWALCSEVYRGK